VALKANPATTKIVMYVLAALLVILMLAGLGTSNRVKKYMNDISQVNLKELIKELKGIDVLRNNS
jgi:ABC-type transport system involved in cytochrome bd biosynthesis fused ATPase/permease subunit